MTPKHGDETERPDERLDYLRLPSNLAGKRLLLVGCDKADLCAELLKRDVSRVISADLYQETSERARINPANGAEYIWRDFDNSTAETFDIVIVSDIINSSPNQALVLQNLHTVLAHDGLLVLEYRMLDVSGKELHSIREDGRTQWFATRELLLHTYLQDFASRLVRLPKEKRSDQNPRRYVLHCRKRLPIVLLISGDTTTGKTVLASEFEATASQVLYVDSMIFEIIRGHSQKHPHAISIQQRVGETALRLSGEQKDTNGDAPHVAVAKEIFRLLDADDTLASELVNAICQNMALESRMIVLEGMALTDRVNRQLHERLDGKAVVWEVKRVRRFNSKEDEARQKALAQSRSEAAQLRRQVGELETQLSAFKASTSWRVIRPLRAIWYMAMVQLSRAVSLLLSGYQCLFPAWLTNMVPERVRRVVKTGLRWSRKANR